jgi:hypothetical protein
MKLNNLFKSAMLLVFLHFSFGVSAQTPIKTESGYTLINHTNKKGVKAKAGDAANINLYGK